MRYLLAVEDSIPAPQEIVLTAEDAGQRLDKVLCARIPALGRASVKKLFATGKISVVSEEGRRRRAVKGDLGSAGMRVTVDVGETDPRAVPDLGAPLTVVLETEMFVVVDKPAGQPTAPLAPGERGALANALVARYPEMAQLGFSPREPGLCHRLDTETSGLVIAARTQRAFDAIVTALRDGRLDKRYLALVRSEGLPDSSTIDIPLAAHPKDRRRVLACIHPRDVARNDPRPAVTTFEKVSERDGVALVMAHASRALRHQVRAHFAAIEFPLLGDTLYGGETMAGLNRHALHASHITFKGEAGVPAFSVTSELPEDLAKFCGPPATG